jgi:hypothetical protein
MPVFRPAPPAKVVVGTGQDGCRSSQPALPQSWLQSVNQPQNWPVAPFESQPIPKPAGFVITLFWAVITNVGILHKKPIFDEFPFV